MNHGASCLPLVCYVCLSFSVTFRIFCRLLLCFKIETLVDFVKKDSVRGPDKRADEKDYIFCVCAGSLLFSQLSYDQVAESVFYTHVCDVCSFSLCPCVYVHE